MTDMNRTMTMAKADNWTGACNIFIIVSVHVYCSDRVLFILLILLFCTGALSYSILIHTGKDILLKLSGDTASYA